MTDKAEIEAVAEEGREAAPIAPSEVPPQIMPDSISRDDDKVAMSRLFRAARIEGMDADSRRVRLAFSSEEPVERSFGMEVLSHDADAIDLDFLGSGRAPLLLDHDLGRQIGVVENVTVDSDRRGRAVVRFGKGALSREVLDDVVDGVRANVSVGYRINELERESDREDEGLETFVARRWTPLEVSIVAIPADTSVGVGREGSTDTFDVHIRQERTTHMSDQTNAVEAEAPAPQVDTAKIANEARSNELSRIREIMAIGTQHQVRELAERAIDNGTSLAEFKGRVLEHLAATGSDKPLAQPVDQPDISTKEQQNFSLVRAIRAAATNDWSGAGYEREVSAEIARNTGRDPKGFYVPAAGWGQRNLIVGANADGGFMKPTDHLGNEFIAALRGRIVVAGLGARVMTGLSGDVAVPKISAGGTAAFVGEGSAVAEVNQTFAQVTMAPKTLGTFTDLSRKLIYQSDPSAEAVIRDDLLAAVAAKIEDVAIEGGGSNEPTGITQTSGIGSVAIGTNGGAPTWASVTALVKEVEQDNAALSNSQAFLTNPKVKHKLAGTAKVGSSDSVMVLDAPWNELYGYPMGITTHTPSDLTKGSTSGTCSAMIFGDFAQMMIGFWSATDVLVDPYTGGPQGNIRILVHQDLDVAIRHAQSFAACLDYTTT